VYCSLIFTYFRAIRCRDLDLVLLALSDLRCAVGFCGEGQGEDSKLIFGSMVLISVPVIEIAELISQQQARVTQTD